MHQDKVDIHVIYPPAKDELRDNHAQRSETLGSLKTRVLAAFGLKEGDDEHGKLTTFSFFHHHHELSDLSKTLGEVAGTEDLLRLELARERYHFFYGEKKIFSQLEVATGGQIKAMIKAVDPGFDPSYELILEGHGHHPDKVITDTDTISLEVGEGHPVKHFFSKPPTNFGDLFCCRR